MTPTYTPRLFAGLILVAALAACRPTPPGPVPPVADADATAPADVPDAADPADAAPERLDAPAPVLDAYGRACANLAALGCADGVAPSCPRVLARTDAARLVRGLDVACLATATTRAGARACGAACP